MKFSDKQSIEPLRSVAFISSQAFSVYNFRGPLIRALVEKGIRVYALAPDFDDETRAAVAALGAEPIDVSLSRAGMNPLKDAADVLRISRLLRKMKVDATFCYFIKPVIYGTLAAAFAGVTKRFAMIEGAGYVFNDDARNLARRLLRSVVKVLYRLGLGAAQRVFMLNPDDYALFTGSGMVTGEKVTLLDGIGVDLKHFSPLPIPSGPLCFIMVARLLTEKGVREYLAAAEYVKARYPEVRFLLLGAVDVNPSSLSQEEINAWVAKGVVECPGHVADVRDWMKQAGVFVLPSYREGLPRSTMEALAMARPVITSDAVGCRETVIEGVNGYKVPVRDASKLAEAMTRFIENPQLMVPMALESRKMAENKFDVNIINAKILSIMGISRI